ncbi:hypothetical protein RJ641_033022, partial [Dillenia turbinata]
LVGRIALIESIPTWENLVFFCGVKEKTGKPKKENNADSKSKLPISFSFSIESVGPEWPCIWSGGKNEIDPETVDSPNKTRLVEVPQRISPRPVCQLKVAGSEPDSASSSNHSSKTPKDRSPKVTERRSPRSPVTEKKRLSRVLELEFQISQLQEDLKKVKDQLSSSESCKRQAQQEVEDSKKQLLAMSSKAEETQKQLQELSASEESHLIEIQKVSQERDKAWQSELEAVQKQHSNDSAALASALNEIQRLKVQLEMVAECEATQTKHVESEHAELETLKEKLAETLSLVENMKTQLKDCKESEDKAQALASETLPQLEMAKKTVEMLKLDANRAMEAYNSIALEFDQSRARVNVLKGLVSKLQADLTNACGGHDNKSGDNKCDPDIREIHSVDVPIGLEAELKDLNSEVGHLRSALEKSEIRYHEEQVQSTVQISCAHELVEQLKLASSLRESELAEELKKAKADIEELKANLMDKETELQGIVEENEGLNSKIENLSCQEHGFVSELMKLKENIAELKANLMDKETELQNILEENEMLKLEVSKRETDADKAKNGVAELEAAKAAEREALMKLGYVAEEADKSNRKAARAAEQLEAAQAANAEMEAELRRLKVQSDQWRKAAEAAAAMLSAGNNGKFAERTGSLDGNYDPFTGKLGSPYLEDLGNDSLKKKNGNVLKKIGIFRKKSQK